MLRRPYGAHIYLLAFPGLTPGANLWSRRWRSLIVMAEGLDRPQERAVRCECRKWQPCKVLVVAKNVREEHKNLFWIGISCR